VTQGQKKGFVDASVIEKAVEDGWFSQLTLTVTASYREGRKMHRKSHTQRFTVRVNSEQIIRRVGNLGNILGLTPKSMR